MIHWYIYHSEWLQPNAVDVFVKIIRDNHMIIDCYHNLYKALYRIPTQKQEPLKVSHWYMQVFWMLININKDGTALPLLSQAAGKRWRQEWIDHDQELYLSAHVSKCRIINDLSITYFTRTLYHGMEYNLFNGFQGVGGELTRLLNQCSNKHVSWDHATKGLTVVS